MKELTQAEFGALISSGTVLLKFQAPWCKPCAAMQPVLEALAKERPDVTFAAVNIDAEPMLSRQFGVRSVPTLMLFKDGGVEATKVGLQSKKAIAEML